MGGIIDRRDGDTFVPRGPDGRYQESHKDDGIITIHSGQPSAQGDEAVIESKLDEPQGKVDTIGGPSGTPAQPDSPTETPEGGEAHG